MTIFLLLNGMGVVFLLYVLASFWKEGHRAGDNGRICALELGWRNRADVVVITHAISRAARGSVSVIPFQARSREMSGRLDGDTGSREATRTPAGRVSAR